MPHHTSRVQRLACTSALALIIGVTSFAGAQAVNLIADLDFTQTSLILDSAGDIYGTTTLGGTSANCNSFGCGTVFELSPTGSGYTKTTLYSFNGYSASGDNDGSWPTAGLVLDSKGRLFGTTGNGGSSSDAGTVFMLTHSSSGWKETILHTFSGTDGFKPAANLLMDSHGNLYGTTVEGGAFNQGTVFMLSPTASGWKHAILHSFSAKGDGAQPYGIIFDAAGNIYGNTFFGGTTANDCGEVFELSRTSTGWKETNLHIFTGKNGDGCQTVPFFAFDAAGRLYGTTSGGGNDFFSGTVFTLSHASGVWKESVIYRFTGADDGGAPGAIAFSPSGELFGITNYGAPAGCNNLDGCSQIFKLTHGSGGWTVSAVYPTPLREPSLGGLIFDKNGSLFGATTDDHYFQYGDAFELTP
jgi:uncharacterized repeat protein (TIGR03803 family)